MNDKEEILGSQPVEAETSQMDDQTKSNVRRSESYQDFNSNVTNNESN